MDQSVKWQIALIAPGEREISLLAALGRRPDVHFVGVLDPDGRALGTAIAEVMGIPVHASFAEADWPEEVHLVAPADTPSARALIPEDRMRRIVGSDELRRLVLAEDLTVRRARRAGEGEGPLELEHEAIHRALSRIEEILDRESLLRWLLSLATRAVGATSGSIMLRDEATEELYIAFAYGLSEAVLHRTRVPVGRGIAGRVARDRRSELVTGRPPRSRSGDRPDIASAISAPLIWEDHVLGVLNVSTSEGDRHLGEDELATIDRLAHRLALILHRFLALQATRDGRLCAELSRRLAAARQTAAGAEDVPGAWATALAGTVGAVRAGIAIVCDDGGLLVGESVDGHEPAVRYDSAPDTACAEVLERGTPLVVRQSEPDPDGGDGLTAFYLPVGRPRILAVLSLMFDSAPAAHRFHDVSGEVVYALERSLRALEEEVRQRDRLRRLSELAGVLSELAASGAETDAERRERILSAACGLTGAREAVLVTGIENELALLARGSSPRDTAWRRESARLLEDAAAQGWRVTMVSSTLEPREEEASVLAVTARIGRPAPGILLYGKQRRHPLDGAVFTDFDGDLAARLAPLLLEPARPAILVEERLPEEAPLAREAAAGGEEAGTAAARAQRDVLLETLRREMDRCDRYHTTFAVCAFRTRGGQGWPGGAAMALAQRLAASMRSSDFLTALEDGTILVLVPEDVHAVSRIQRRVIGLLEDLGRDPGLAVVGCHAVYPGRHDDAARLLDDTLDALRREAGGAGEPS